MKTLKCLVLALCLIMFASESLNATIIEEVLEPPSRPGNAFTGTFLITPSESTWAFGVGNDAIQDTSISGIASIDGLEANDHWVSALISNDSWNNGFDFNSARPIGATPPSSFAIDTTTIPWQWGSSDYVAFYWLSEAGSNSSNPLAVLQTGTTYNAFKFFTSGPNSPFATFGAADGGNILTGETIVTVVPEPSTFVLAGLALLGLVACGYLRRGTGQPGVSRGVRHEPGRETC